jgi:rhodanese-related sulfurtransferase
VNTIAQIRPHQFSEWLASVQKLGTVLVLDVREPVEITLASIRPDGFTVQHIPMGSIPANLAELNPSQPIACLCHHGARSMQVAMFLKNQGFQHVVNIAGGIHAWSSELDTSVPCY